MSLYYDAARFLAPSEEQSGSLKSRVFGSKELKASPKQVYAIVAEASKWSPILAEVVEKSQLLQHERKLTPSLALLLVHDLILSKSGIATPATHPLRLAVTKHKARLSAELTKIRIRRGFGSIDGLRNHIAKVDVGETESDIPRTASSTQLQHPRWVRINTLKSTLEDQLQTTFAGFEMVDSLERILVGEPAGKILHVDKHVPDLIALAPGTDLSKTAAYRRGIIILQDKASCFPAYLLDAKPQDGTCLDACAAPGNKTTHLAAILKSQNQIRGKPRIWACERDKVRAGILTGMIDLAGCQDIVTVKAGQDFLLLNPEQKPWNEVGSLLLDPSCSGSGIIGRNDIHAVTLPSTIENSHVPDKSRKRKRHVKTDTKSIVDEAGEEKQELIQPGDGGDQLQERLKALSAFQLRLLLHAFRFPNARRISYSTCSIHAEENEHVVIAALQSSEAKQYGWHMLGRDEQINGMKAWPFRGDIQVCQGRIVDGSPGAAQIAEACIRCRPGTEEGTQGFFVAAFVRSAQEVITHGLEPDFDQDDPQNIESSTGDSFHVEEDEDWNGLSDSDDISAFTKYSQQ
ncbi:MAG: hypothetical protein L6R38_007506 [Xanthoria sp. 2 TBL-2021]|nr:MAG: hypothetical protein L6R38_007506 [Xanthoria sp. 2 TBL-2021]